MRSAAEELRMTAADPVSQRVGEVVVRQSGYLDRMIDALLDISQLQRDCLPIVHSDVDLYTVVEESVEPCRAELESKNQRLVVELPDEPVQMRGDQSRIIQIVRSLLENAVKFTGNGGSVYLLVNTVGPDIEVVVRDTGRGLAREELERVFDPFVQLRPDEPSDPDTNPETGLGISLCIAQHLVALHNGTIRVESAGPGEGAQFSVRLPLAGA